MSMKKDPWEKDYTDYVWERNKDRLLLGLIVVAILGMVYLLDKYFHFLSK